MSSRSLTNYRLTEIEGQAHSDALRRFAPQLEEFSPNLQLIQRLEQDISKIALAVMAVSYKPAAGLLMVLAEDGSQWFKSLDISNDVFVCHRYAGSGMEYAIMACGTSGANEIQVRGRNAVEVLKAFAHDQRRALEGWTAEMATRVRDFLAEQYPGRDLRRVTESLMRQFTHAGTARRAA